MAREAAVSGQSSARPNPAASQPHLTELRVSVAASGSPRERRMEPEGAAGVKDPTKRGVEEAPGPGGGDGRPPYTLRSDTCRARRASQPQHFAGRSGRDGMDTPRPVAAAEPPRAAVGRPPPIAVLVVLGLPLAGATSREVEPVGPVSRRRRPSTPASAGRPPCLEAALPAPPRPSLPLPALPGRGGARRRLSAPLRGSRPSGPFPQTRARRGAPQLPASL